MIKKLSALILTCSLITSFYGCNTNNTSLSENTGSGRYTEKELNISEKPVIAGELFICRGKTAFIDTCELKLYTEDEEGKTFIAQPLPSLSDLGSDIAVSSIAGGPDGSFIFSYYPPDDENENDDGNSYPKPKYAYVSPDGTLQKVDITIKYGFEAFDISDNGNIYASSFSGDIYQIDVKEQSAELLFSVDGHVTSFDTVSDYLITSDSSQIYFYDLKNKKAVKTPAPMTDFNKEQGLKVDNINDDGPVYDFCQGNDNSIYIISKKGLYRYVMDGNNVEQLLDGSSYHIGNPAYTISSVQMKSDNSFIVNYRQGNVMIYNFDASASNKISSDLKIYSLKENATLGQIISEFRISHPDVSVELEIGMADGDSITYEDAIKNLNTEILSDKAPDIIMLDGMDSENYVKKNMLLDLKEYEKKIDPDDQLLDKIAKQYSNGKLYTMTCKFELPVLVASKDNLSKINDFSSFADMVEDQHKSTDINTVTDFYTEEEVLNTAMDFNGNKIISDGSLNVKELTSMLEDCLKIYKNDRAAFTDQQISDYTGSKNSSKSPDSKWGYEVPGRSMCITHDPQKITCGTIDGFTYGINIITSLNDIQPDANYRYGLSDDSSIYIPVCTFGICSSAKDPDSAANFLNTAFTQAVQNIELNDGLPVNMNSLRYFYDKHKTEKGMGFATYEMFTDNELLVGAKWLDDSESEQLQQAVEKLNTPVQIDTMTKDLILDIGTQCLDQSITVEQAVNQINEKLSLKMQE